MEFRNVSTQDMHDRAYSNNTFDLPATESAIRTAVENSYNYLNRIQKSYVDIRRFIYSTDDLYVDSNGNVCLTIDKGFIEASDRYEYRNSPYYLKWLTMEEINSLTNIFSYIPIITIDNKSVFSYKIRCELDGKTHIMFTHIDNYQTFIGDKTVEDLPSYIEHKIEVTVIKNTHYESAKLPNSVLTTGIIPYSLFKDIDTNKPVFLYLKHKDASYGSQIIRLSYSEDGMIIDTSNPILTGLFDIGDNIYAHVYQPVYGNTLVEKRLIKHRTDNDNKSVTVVIEPTHLKTYSTPIPDNNLIIIVHDNETGFDHLETERSVMVHYPNIYEIDCSDLDENKHEISVYYLYKNLDDILKYSNKLEYIHKYYCNKFNSSLDDAINTLLYTTRPADEDFNKIKQFFFSLFNYTDMDYVYSISDFERTLKPYDFDYKVNKMKSFVNNDPNILIDYGDDVSVITEVYTLDVRTIDLEKRLRNDTRGETTNPEQIITFDEPSYVFAFRNDAHENLNLRIFVDGLLRTTLVHITSRHMDYIYIPQSLITEKSIIEIEKFEDYRYTKTVTLNSDTDEVVLDIRNSPLSTPTYFDLYVTDSNRNRLDKSKFTIMAMTTNGEDDYINLTDKNLDVTYYKITKLKISTSYSDYIGIPITWSISKSPYLCNKVMDSAGYATGELPTTGYKWNEDKSYVRFFLNGRYIKYDFNYIKNDDVYGTYFVIDKYVRPGDVVTYDITPYSYILEMSVSEVPGDFIVDITGKLTKPFNSAYYDVYLNGRKLTDMNIQMLGTHMFKLINVHSNINLYIFRKDRDIEYYRMSNISTLPIDILLNSNLISDEDKDYIIDTIIRDNIGEYSDPDNTEPNAEDILNNDIKSVDIFGFYYNVIIPRGKMNELNSIIKKAVVAKYPKVSELYEENNRIVIRPSMLYNANGALIIGRNTNLDF